MHWHASACPTRTSQTMNPARLMWLVICSAAVSPIGAQPLTARHKSLAAIAPLTAPLVGPLTAPLTGTPTGPLTRSLPNATATSGGKPAAAAASLSTLERYVVHHQQQIQDLRAQISALASLNQRLTDRLQVLENTQLQRLQNVALYRPTSQSTYQYTGGLGFPFFAVDGNADADFEHGSCIHTQNEAGKRSWWQVDLEGLYDVSTILIVNVRNQDGPGRLRNVDVTLYEEDPSLNPAAPARLCFHHVGPLKAGVNVINCDAGSLPGRYVRVTNTAGEYLTLCEVQVLAVPSS